jgi:hypothetical protein
MGTFENGGNSLKYYNYSFFGQDTWRATKKLTLTYGLRWDINPSPAASDENPLYVFTGVFDTKPQGLEAATRLFKTDFSAFAPRVGLAYQLSEKMVVRGGIGMFYDIGVPQTISEQVTLAFPFGRSRSTTGPIPFDYNNIAFTPLPFTLTPPPGNFQPGHAIDPNLQLPVSYQWNVAFEKQFGANHSLSVTYVGQKGEGQIRRDAILQAAPSNWTQISVFHNQDTSRYDSLQTVFQRRLTKGLQAMVQYTLSKSTDSGSGDNPSLKDNQRSLADIRTELDYGYSDFDRRHAFSTGFSYDLPAPKWGKVSNAILRGWGLDGIFRAQSGLGLSPYVQYTVPATGLNQRLRVNRVEGVPIWLEDGNTPGGRRINPAAFAPPPVGERGDLKRNSIRNFPIWQFDMGLRRTFDLTERVKLALKVEYFNILNHPMFSLSSTSMLYSASVNGALRPNFGRVTQTVDTAYSPVSGVGLNPLYQIGGARSGQLTVRFTF